MAEGNGDQRGNDVLAVTSCWMLYDITTATEAPRLALAILQYSLLACALVALVGSAVIYATDR
jgi:hypothetical protein